MKNQLNLNQLSLIDLTTAELESIEGGILKELGIAIGLVIAAIVNDAEDVINGRPVKMPSGMRTMYSAHT